MNVATPASPGHCFYLQWFYLRRGDGGRGGRGVAPLCALCAFSHTHLRECFARRCAHVVSTHAHTHGGLARAEAAMGRTRSAKIPVLLYMTLLRHTTLVPCCQTKCAPEGVSPTETQVASGLGFRLCRVSAGGSILQDENWGVIRLVTA